MIKKDAKFKKGQIPWNKDKKGYKTKPCSNEKRKSISLALSGKGSSYREIRIRFESKIETLITNCWKWRGHIEINGYGRFWYLGRNESAHRISYILYRGPIDFGLTIDHLCKNRWCVNPSHLEVVTIQENLLRSNSISTINKQKEKCKNGHIYSEKNTYIRPNNGGRDCRECHNLLQKQYLVRKNRGDDVQ